MVILLTYHNKSCDEFICPLYFSQDTQSHLESVRNSKISTEKDCSFFQPNSLKNKIHQFILNQIDPLCNKKRRICMGMGGDCTHPFSHLGHGSGCREQRLEVLGPEIMLHVSRVTLCLSHYTFSWSAMSFLLLSTTVKLNPILNCRLKLLAQTSRYSSRYSCSQFGSLSKQHYYWPH